MNDSIVEKKRAPRSKSRGLTEMSDDWLSWVDENISRGCSPKDIINILVQNKYDRDYAKNLVFGKLDTSSSSKRQKKAQNFSEPQNYDYEEIGPKLDGRVIKTHDREISILLTLTRPRIILFSNVLSQDECEQLIELSKPKINRSTTVDNLTGKEELHQDRRSSGTYFQLNETPLIERIDRRLAELMQVPLVNGEGLQILNYQMGGEYKPHFDYFSPELSGSKTHIARGGQRIATLILYLNNVEQGGDTIFPKIDLKVTPSQGNALYFAYTNSKNQLDPLTLHGGCPVLRGEKWIATKWVRQNKYK